MATYVEQHPDTYLAEIETYFNYSTVAVLYVLRKMGITRTRITTYQEQDPVKVGNCQRQLKQLEEPQIAHVDETSINIYWNTPELKKEGIKERW